MLAATTARRRLLMQATATVALLLLVGFTLLMHSMVGHAGGHSYPMSAASSASVSMQHQQAVTQHEHASDHGAPVAAAGTAMTAVNDASDSDLCALMCSLVGMACTLTIALFAWVLVRDRSGGVLHLLARLLALAAHVPRSLAIPRPPSLSALQIIRV